MPTSSIKIESSNLSLSYYLKEEKSRLSNELSYLNALQNSGEFVNDLIYVNKGELIAIEKMLKRFI